LLTAFFFPEKHTRKHRSKAPKKKNRTDLSESFTFICVLTLITYLCIKLINKAMDNGLITIPKAAEICHVSAITVRNWIKKGIIKVKFVKKQGLKSTFYISEAEVLELINKNKSYRG
jgi:predicted thioesterase